MQGGKIMKDRNNRRVEETEWHRIICFNGVTHISRRSSLRYV